MADRSERIYTYVTPEEVAQVDEFAERAGKSRSDILRQAIQEYIDHDRYDRIEERLKRIETELGTSGVDDSDAAHTHISTNDRVTMASRTVEKTRAIAKRLQENHNNGLNEAELERAIKDIGGADPRTLEKYKTELKERGHAFAHPDPDSHVWYLDREPFLGRVEAVAKNVPKSREKVKRLLSEYPTIAFDEVLGEEVVVADD